MTGPGEDPRIFIGWDAPALPRVAALLCDRYATGDAIALDGAAVVLPGARAGRRLKELLLEEAASLGLPLIPPRVVTVGQLPQLLYRPARPEAEPALARRVWAESLRDAPADRLAQVFPRRPATDALGEWAALARELARLQAEVAAAGLRFRDVAGRCGDAPLHDDFNRWEVLGEVQTDYQARLARLGWSDRDLSRLEAMERGRAGLDRDLWLVAVAELPAATARMIASLMGGGHPVRVVVHAPAEEARRFDDLGCVRAEAWLHTPIPVEDAVLSIQDRPEDQALEVARTLASYGGRFAAEDVVVGVPRRELVPFIEQRLAGAGVAVHDAAGEPVSRTAPYRLLAGVADYLDGRRFEALAALARHPDIGAWLREGAGADGPFSELDGWLEPMDRYFGRRLPARVVGRLPGETERDGQVVRELVDTLERRLLGGPGRGSVERRAGIREWAEWAITLLQEVYGRRSLVAAQSSHRRLAAALGAIAEAAAALRRLPPELDAPCTAPDGLRLLLGECAGVAVPADPARGAVELLGWLEIQLDDAPAAIITGVSEPDLPDSVSAHAFLPDGLRSLLGLVDNDRRYARDAYQLTAVLHSRRQRRLIVGRRSATGDPLRPSRLVLATDDVALAERVRRLYHDLPARPQEPRGSGAGGFEPYTAEHAGGDGAGAGLVDGKGDGPRGFRLPPEPVIPVPSPLRPLRVTDFRLLLEDPYAYALERVLGLEPLDDAARELDGRGFGDLAHRVLEQFGRSAEANVADAAAIGGRLAALLDQEVGRRFGPHVHVAVRVQVEQLRARLRRFAARHAEWVADGWRVVSTECSTPPGGMAFPVDGEPVFLTARVDRIDHHAASGEWAVFDYKTGDRGDDPESTHRRGRGTVRAWADLQLPLYRRILPDLVDGRGEPVATGSVGRPVRLGYIVLPRDLDGTGILIAPWTEAELAEAEEVARQVVRRLRREPFRFDPARPRPRFTDPRMEALLGRGQLAMVDEDEEEASG
jgi:ATP-dependent helicase/nuclease subunit B